MTAAEGKGGVAWGARRAHCTAADGHGTAKPRPIATGAVPLRPAEAARSGETATVRLRQLQQGGLYNTPPPHGGFCLSCEKEAATAQKLEAMKERRTHARTSAFA